MRVEDARPRRRYHARAIFPAGHLPVLARRYCLNGDHVPHDHDFVEAVVVLGGEGAHLSVHGERRLAAGDAFLMRPGAWHTYADCRDLEVYNCCFGVELLRRELAGLVREPSLGHLLLTGPLAAGARGILFLRLGDEDVSACRALLDAMAAEDAAPLAAVERVGLLLLFLARLARSVPPPEAALAPAPEALPPAVRRVVELLEGEPERDWTLADLAGTVHLERSHLVRRFKAATGLPPMAYLARFRAERAANLLLRTDLPVSEIAQTVGWPDPNYFARRFRAHFGLSATEYRARFRPSPGG